MNKSTAQLYRRVLDGVQQVKRGDAIKLLRALGFKHRKSNSNHDLWQHPDCAAAFTWNFTKNNEPVWGYHMTGFRKAIQDYDDHVKAQNPEPEIEEMPTPSMAKIDTLVRSTRIHITSTNLPEEVMELLYSYENKDLTGWELCQMLTDSGYRTATGKEYTTQNMCSLLINHKMYQTWKKSRMLNDPASIGKPKEEKPVDNTPLDSVPATIFESKHAPPVRSFVPEPAKPAKPVAPSPQEILYSLTAIMDENAKLKEENERLNAVIKTIRALVWQDTL